MAGTTLLDLSLAMDPSTLFTTVGTQVQLAGSATVRHWSPDCSHTDAGAQTVWNLSYQSLDGGLFIDVTSTLLAEDPHSRTNQFTPGIPVRPRHPLARALAPTRKHKGASDTWSVKKKPIEATALPASQNEGVSTKKQFIRR
jgi:hypothetical protein